MQKKNTGMNLTIFISKPDGNVDLNDCEKLFKALDEPLDSADPTNGSPYIMNISSLGLDRPIKSDKDFNRCLNSEVTVKTYEAIDSAKQFEGTLSSFNNNEISLLLTNGKIVNINRLNIAVCKLNIKF